MTQIFQCFKLLRRSAVVKSELTLLEKQGERTLVNSIILPQYPFGLIPKVLDSINVIFASGKMS